MNKKDQRCHECGWYEYSDTMHRECPECGASFSHVYEERIFHE